MWCPEGTIILHTCRVRREETSALEVHISASHAIPLQIVPTSWYLTLTSAPLPFLFIFYHTVQLSPLWLPVFWLVVGQLFLRLEFFFFFCLDMIVRGCTSTPHSFHGSATISGVKADVNAARFSWFKSISWCTVGLVDPSHLSPTVFTGAFCHPAQEIQTNPCSPSSYRMPQTLEERGDQLHINDSPYGHTRNTDYGWPNALFPGTAGEATSARVPASPWVRIGTSSLNAVPGKERTFSALLATYERKFSCLEHCYPYHRAGSKEQWASWRVHAEKRSPRLRLDGRPLKPLPASRFTCGVAPPLDVPAFAADPGRFMYTVKANRFLTHDRRLQCELQEVRDHIHLFFNELCGELVPHLGPVLVQLPPSFERNATNLDRLRQLHQQLPQDEVVLVRQLPGSLLAWERQRRIRVAVEFRHQSWYHAETFALCRQLGWGIVVSDLSGSGGDFAGHIDTGTSFMYCRLHGSMGKCIGDYGPARMQLWADRLRCFLDAPTQEKGASEREIFCFLNNNDSNVGGVTSSVVDATYLAGVLRHAFRCGPALPSEVIAPVEDAEAETATNRRRKRDRSPSITYISKGCFRRPSPPPQCSSPGQLNAPPTPHPSLLLSLTDSPEVLAPTTKGTVLVSPSAAMPPKKPQKEVPPTPEMERRLEALMADIEGSSVEDWKTLGNQCFSNGSHLTAIKCYTKAIDKNKGNNEGNVAAVLLSNRSAAYLKSSMFSGPAMALKDAEAAVKLNDKWFKAHLRVGDAQFERKKFNEAKASYERALELEPSNQSAQVSLKATKKELFLRDLEQQEKDEQKKSRAEGNDEKIDKGESKAKTTFHNGPIVDDDDPTGRKRPPTEEETAKLISAWSKDISVREDRTAMKPRNVSLEEADRQKGADYKQRLLGNFRNKLETNSDVKEKMVEKVAATQLMGEGTDYRQPEKYRNKYARATDGIGLAITTDAFKDHTGTAKLLYSPVFFFVDRDSTWDIYLLRLKRSLSLPSSAYVAVHHTSRFKACDCARTQEKHSPEDSDNKTRTKMAPQ
eukprot:gene5136-3687_t